MKRQLIIAMLVLLVTQLTVIAAVDRPNIRITLLNQQPDPVEPGDYVDIRLKTENIGLSAAEEVSIRLEPKYPFSLDPGASDVAVIGNLFGLQGGDEAIITKFKLYVDDNAVEGENPIELQYRFGEGSWISGPKYNISVRPQQLVVHIESVDVIPEKVSPGGSATIKVSVANSASSDIKDVVITLDLDDVPVAPLNSVNQVSIARINSGETRTAEFKVISEPDAESDVYKIPMEITFLDDLANEYSLSTDLGLIVFDKPSYLVNLEESKVYVNGQKGSVVISVSNIGTSLIKFYVITLEESEDYDIISVPRLYLGNLESDDFQTADFDIYMNSDKKAVPLKLKATYKDSFNKEYEEAVTLTLPLFTEQEAKQYGLISGNGGSSWYFLLIIVAVIGWYGYRRWKKKKR